MAKFLGTYENKVDSKGRISVPSVFRAQLQGDDAQTVVVFPSYRAPCIEGCAMDFIDDLAQSMTEIDLFSDDQDDLATSIFSDSHPLQMDSGGRIILPSELMEHAGIAKTAAFVGKGYLFQIWEPRALHRHKQDARERAKAKGLTLRLRRGEER